MSTELTLYRSHANEWRQCTRCFLHETRSKVVLARGSVPAEVVFVGEAPGESEDSLGIPFVGPAGKLLDHIVQKAFPGHWENKPVDPKRRRGTMPLVYQQWVPDVGTAFTNLIGCIPRDEEGHKVTEPPADSVEACKPRLYEFLKMCNPKMIVCVGAQPRDWFQQGYSHSIKTKVPTVHIDHPAALLRANAVHRDMGVQRCVVVLEDALEEYVLGQ
jgi:uracil-DNA glycosylase